MPLRTSELALSGGVNPQTLRYYEREGLLPRPPRLGSGYRLYPESAVTRIRFIKRSQELGFTLAEIRDLLSLRVDKHRDREEVRQIAEARLAEIDARILSLETMRSGSPASRAQLSRPRPRRRVSDPHRHRFYGATCSHA